MPVLDVMVISCKQVTLSTLAAVILPLANCAALPIVVDNSTSGFVPVSLTVILAIVISPLVSGSYIKIYPLGADDISSNLIP
jgi:hypothetical protein